MWSTTGGKIRLLGILFLIFSSLLVCPLSVRAQPYPGSATMTGLIGKQHFAVSTTRTTFFSNGAAIPQELFETGECFFSPVLHFVPSAFPTSATPASWIAISPSSIKSATFSGDASSISYKEPRPDMKINGSDGPVLLDRGQNITISIGFDPGSRLGNPSEWWVGVISWEGSYYFSLGQYPMFNLSLLPLFTLPLNSTGYYAFFFAVDDLPDGKLQLTYVDYVTVTTKEQ